MSLGTKLRSMRQQRNLSQTQVAAELDVSQTAYNKWESDLTKPGIDNLLKISEFYETDIYDLLNDSQSDTFSNNSYDNSLNSSQYITRMSTVNNYFSEKLMEQYESRIKDLENQLEYWKSKAQE